MHTNNNLVSFFFSRIIFFSFFEWIKLSVCVAGGRGREKRASFQENPFQVRAQQLHLSFEIKKFHFVESIAQWVPREQTYPQRRTHSRRNNNQGKRKNIIRQQHIDNKTKRQDYRASRCFTWCDVILISLCIIFAPARLLPMFITLSWDSLRCIRWGVLSVYVNENSIGKFEIAPAPLSSLSLGRSAFFAVEILFFCISL